MIVTLDQHGNVVYRTNKTEQERLQKIIDWLSCCTQIGLKSSADAKACLEKLQVEISGNGEL